MTAVAPTMQARPTTPTRGGLFAGLSALACAILPLAVAAVYALMIWNGARESYATDYSLGNSQIGAVAFAIFFVPAAVVLMIPVVPLAILAIKWRHIGLGVVALNVALLAPVSIIVLCIVYQMRHSLTPLF